MADGPSPREQGYWMMGPWENLEEALLSLQLGSSLRAFGTFVKPHLGLSILQLPGRYCGRGVAPALGCPHAHSLTTPWVCSPSASWPPHPLVPGPQSPSHRSLKGSPLHPDGPLLCGPHRESWGVGWAVFAISGNRRSP